MLIEVCAGGVEDAVAAAELGARRIELNAALEVGGLTPSAASLQRTLAAVAVPVVAMIRPRPGGFVYTDEEWRTILADAAVALAAGAQGVACGCLRPAGGIDGGRVRELVALAAGGEVVFHRAFDETPDLEDSLDQLGELGVHRVLTAGGATSALAGAATIRTLIDRHAGVDILPGGGVTPANMVELQRLTGCREVHGSFTVWVEDDGPYGRHLRLDRAGLTAAIAATR